MSISISGNLFAAASLCIFGTNCCRVITFPNAKINIGLRITEKRADGYHNIESIFYPIPLCDALEIVSAPEFKFSNSGAAIDGNPEDNLIVKAYRLLERDFARIKPVHVYLRKQIPMGAGLGGGSADGAFMVRLLNDFFDLGMPTEVMEEYAAALGSDCPFFIRNEPVLVSGRGEVLNPHPLQLKGMFLLLVSPGVHVSTAEAYSGVKPKKSVVNWSGIAATNIGRWVSLRIVNQFEEHILPAHPEIAEAKEMLRKLGAEYQSMTGSGSAVYGLFRQLPNPLPDGIQWLAL